MTLQTGTAEKYSYNLGFRDLYKIKTLPDPVPSAVMTEPSKHMNKGGGVGWGTEHLVMHTHDTDLPSSEPFKTINDSKDFVTFSHANSHCSPHCGIHSSCRSTDI